MADETRIAQIFGCLEVSILSKKLLFPWLRNALQTGMRLFVHSQRRHARFRSRSPAIPDALRAVGQPVPVVRRECGCGGGGWRGSGPDRCTAQAPNLHQGISHTPKHNRANRRKEIMWNLVGPAGTIGIIFVILIISGIKIMKEYQRAVIFRLGRIVAARGPGLIYVIPVH
jgi:hypothetical protein